MYIDICLEFIPDDIARLMLLFISEGRGFALLQKCTKQRNAYLH